MKKTYVSPLMTEVNIEAVSCSKPLGVWLWGKDKRTNLRASECVGVYLRTKRAKAGSTKLKEHKPLAVMSKGRWNRISM